jgi:hypothetical protein
VSTALWSALLAAAVLWPARLAGPLDGVPLDTVADAILIGLVLPVLVALDRRVLAQRLVRVTIVLLLAWKATLGMTMAADGWCLRFTSPAPLFVDDVHVPHAWDVRADWRNNPPRCSAIMTRGYARIDEFPVWFYNLPPANWLQPATDQERPPLVTLQIDVDGSLHVRESGTFRVRSGRGLSLAAVIDGAAVDARGLADGVTLAAGVHTVALSGTARGEDWALQPEWNGRDVFAHATATRAAPHRLDHLARPWARWVTAGVVLALLLLAAAGVYGRVADVTVTGASLAMSAAAAATLGHNFLMRWMPLLLAVPAVLRIPRRLQNILGAQLLLGVPFLVLIAARAYDGIGRVTWYTSGDDWWMFQRFAYRIYLQGYWLEGGEPAFWFQPFYRWIAGALHMIFGDSSVGELFWDGACAWAGALFAFHVTRVTAGFRWAMAAGVLTLLLMTVGPAWYLFGRGLSELTSAGLIYGAALWALRGRSSQKYTLIAGLCLAAAFYTRLNNLPFAAAVAAFSLPIGVAAGDWPRWRQWWPKVSKPALTGLAAAMIGALVLFSLRTYYYTGTVNALSGTQASARSVWQPTGDGESAVQNIIGSVLLVVTMSDPPRFDARAIPLVTGIAAAVLAVAGVGRFRALPLNVSLLCLAGLAGAFVARGSAYPGRFSVHLIPVTAALTVCAIALLTQRRPRRGRQDAGMIA